MKKLLLSILMLLPISLMAQQVTYTIGSVSSTPTVWSSVVAGKYYKFQQGGQVSTHHMSSDGTYMLGVQSSTNPIDEAAVWTLESVSGGYKIKNLNGEYLTNFGSAAVPYYVGVSTEATNGVVFTLSLGNANANNCLFTITTPPANGFAYLHFDATNYNIGFYHNANGQNSQFKLYEVDVTENVVGGGLSEEYLAKLDALTAAYAKMVAPGDYVNAEGNYFVTAAEKAVVSTAIAEGTEETIDAAVAVVATLTEEAGISSDKVYALANNNSLASGVVYVKDDNYLAGTTSALDEEAMNGAHKWMIVAKAGETDTYMLYNVGADRVANSDVVTASDAGSGPEDAWEALNAFETYDRGYVVMEQMNASQWRIRDSQVEGLTDGNKNTLRCYMNTDGTKSFVTCWLQNGTANGNPNSLFNLFYLGEASDAEVAAAAAMMTAIETPKVKVEIDGYATMCYADRALVVPADVVAWTVEYNENVLAPVKIYLADAVVPAGVAVLLEAANGEYEFFLTKEAGVAPATNLLKGGAAPADLSKVYAMVNGASGLGFYKVADDFVNGAHAAYLQLPEEATDAAEVYTLNDLFNENATGIETTAGVKTGVCHDIMGRRVVAPKAGLYVVGGKKCVVK